MGGRRERKKVEPVQPPPTDCPEHGRKLVPTRNGAPRLCCPLYECGYWRVA